MKPYQMPDMPAIWSGSLVWAPCLCHRAKENTRLHLLLCPQLEPRSEAEQVALLNVAEVISSALTTFFFAGCP